MVTQYASPDLIGAIAYDGHDPAQDPNWRVSGAPTQDAYGRWCRHLCGMACLRMALLHRDGQAPSLFELLAGARAYGAYTEDENGEIKGLIYAPFAQYVKDSHGIDAVVHCELTMDGLIGALDAGHMVITSVSKEIRRPEHPPERRGGHLVLVIGHQNGHIVFRNPSGHTERARDSQLPVSVFEEFFGDRGVSLNVRTAHTGRSVTPPTAAGGGSLITVLDEMGELGDQDVDGHRDVGHMCAEHDIDLLIAVGDKLAKQLALAAADAGVLTPVDVDITRLREDMAQALAEDDVLTHPGWRAAVEKVPRHHFVARGFYLPADHRDDNGLTVWEPVTPELNHSQWLSAAYSDTTLITQVDGEEPDWTNPAPRHGGAPTSSATLPSLVTRMWADADIAGGHTLLEIGTGTGYSTALACERLGSGAVTSIEVDARCLERAAGALYSLGYTPTLAVADGLYGYWPTAPFDRIVAACSFRSVPRALPAQTRPGGQILLTLSGWLYGYARVLLTVCEDGSAEGPLLPGTVSFMPARTHAPPAFGSLARWAADLPATGRAAQHSPERITTTTDDAFHLRFLTQCVVPDTQIATMNDVIHLIDIVTGSAATLTPHDGWWEVRERGPDKLWEQIESLLGAYDAAGQPGPETFRLHIDDAGQYLRHPRMPILPLPDTPL